MVKTRIVDTSREVPKSEQQKLVILKALEQQRKPLTKQKDNLLNGRKYLQILRSLRG